MLEKSLVHFYQRVETTVPTNVFRSRITNSSRPLKKSGGSRRPAPLSQAARTERYAVLAAGSVSVRLEVLPTTTSDLIWRALPIFSVCETWGQSIHFECPVRAGRERTASVDVAPGDVCYASADDCVILAWGQTPISQAGKIRLMHPSNIWARVIGDPSDLQSITPGEKVSLEHCELLRTNAP